MRLNEESKEKLREQIEKLCINANEIKKRIPLDSELLEQLLFKIQKMADGTVVKFPVWSGKFLSKIDLSQISFENVCWNLTSLENYQEKYAAKRPEGSGFFDILYSETNAMIDFSKVYRLKNKEFLYKCDFSGTDLRQNHIDSLDIEDYQYYCDFRNTGLKIVHDLSTKVPDLVRSLIINCRFDQCYFNDKLIIGRVQQQRLLSEYNVMVQKYSDEITEAFQKAKK